LQALRRGGGAGPTRRGTGPRLPATVLLPRLAAAAPVDSALPPSPLPAVPAAEFMSGNGNSSGGGVGFSTDLIVILLGVAVTITIIAFVAYRLNKIERGLCCKLFKPWNWRAEDTGGCWGWGRANRFAA
jgi:hypothetical protein